MTGETHNLTEATLIQRLLAGEQNAFEALVKTYHLPMKRVAAAIVDWYGTCAHQPLPPARLRPCPTPAY